MIRITLASISTLLLLALPAMAADEFIASPTLRATLRALPLCRWPAWPHYKAGAVSEASSFTCAP